MLKRARNRIDWCAIAVVLAMFFATSPAMVHAETPAADRDDISVVPGSGIPLPEPTGFDSLIPSPLLWGFNDPLLQPILDRLFARLIADPSGRWVEWEEAADLFDETDAAVLRMAGSNDGLFAQYLADTLVGAVHAYGREAAVDRADLAIEIERRNVALAALFGGYFSGPIPAVPTPGNVVRDHVLQWTIMEIIAARNYVASGQDTTGGAARTVVLLEAKLFEWMQALMSGEGARASVRSYRPFATRDRLDALRQRAEAVIVHLRSLYGTGPDGAMLPETIMTYNHAALGPELNAAMVETAADMDWILAEGPEVMTTILPYMVALADVQQALGRDEALVVTTLAGPAYAVYVVTATEARWHATSLPALEVDALAASILDEIGVTEARGAVPLLGAFTPKPQRVGTAAWQLYQQLLAPASDLIAGKSLVVVPAGRAAHFPWQILVASDPGRAARYEDMDWLVRHHAIRVLPAVELLLGPRPLPVDPAEMRYVGFGDPAFGAGPGDWTRLMWSAVLPDLNRLPEAAGEVRNVGALYGEAGRRVLTDTHATEQALYDMEADGTLAEADILHFATHALTSGDHDQVVSGLIALAPQAAGVAIPKISIYGHAAKIADGTLQDIEIRQLQINAALVILSACKTVASQEFETDGITGLAAAFLHAGAQRVLATHWQVNSNAAVEIVTDMMRSDPALEDPAEALRRTMLKSIGRGGTRADPAYWAAFSLIGQR